MAYDVKDFKKEVIDRSTTVPVLVDFWAEWCGPCKMLSPILDRLEAAAGGKWVLAKLDTEDHPKEVVDYRIQGIPAVKLFFEGKVVAEFVGALPEYAVRQWLAKVLPDTHRRQVEEAAAVADQGRVGDAKAILEGILREEPGNRHAREVMARLILFDDPDRAATLIEGEDSGDSELGGAVKTILDLLRRGAQDYPAHPVRERHLAAVDDLRNRRFEEALQKFIAVIREERYYDDDGARKVCIAIFKFLGDNHPLTLKYRREFSSALY